MAKIALGTAQFGLDYGINNPRGKVPETEVFEILDYASAQGLDMLDTAAAYGDSESILGSYLARGSRFDVVSKLPAGAPDGTPFETSLKKLGVATLYAYLVHDFASFLLQPRIWPDLVRFKERGLIRKIGFSLYYPEQAAALEKTGIIPDLVQVPYSVFDRRFADHFAAMKERGIEIHVRSVFLQGLVFKRPDELRGPFEKLRAKAEALRRIADAAHVSISALCLDFALLEPFVDRVVIGVDSLENLRENLENLSHIGAVRAVRPELESLREEDERILLPYLWPS